MSRPRGGRITHRHLIVLNRIAFELRAARLTLIDEFHVWMLVKPIFGNNLVNLRMESRLVHWCTSLYAAVETLLRLKVNRFYRICGVLLSYSLIRNIESIELGRIRIYDFVFIILGHPGEIPLPDVLGMREKSSRASIVAPDYEILEQSAPPTYRTVRSYGHPHQLFCKAPLEPLLYESGTE